MCLSNELTEFPTFLLSIPRSICCWIMSRQDSDSWSLLGIGFARTSKWWGYIQESLHIRCILVIGLLGLRDHRDHVRILAEMGTARHYILAHPADHIRTPDIHIPDSVVSPTKFPHRTETMRMCFEWRPHTSTSMNQVPVLLRAPPGSCGKRALYLAWQRYY